MSVQKTAKLYINDDYVGDVALQGIEASWAHGLFEPAPAFTKFAEPFDQWGQLMSANGSYSRISDAVSDALCRLENRIDRLHAKLHFEADDIWVACAQLNIDGPLIEWKSMSRGLKVAQRRVE